ncbi:transposase [Desulfosporosinus sp. FKA]|uniref:IS66 family transposase n=1 Tax=Desulfosporosinus sp. FKA TaxID=1969834 RepID=UPI0032B7D824
MNALPLYRLEQEFKRHDMNISRQNMANWTIQCSERYLSLLYDRMHQELLESPVLQADETPVEVSKDGRAAGSKSYMQSNLLRTFWDGLLFWFAHTRRWVPYHTFFLCDKPCILLFAYVWKL